MAQIIQIVDLVVDGQPKQFRFVMPNDTTLSLLNDKPAPLCPQVGALLNAIGQHDHDQKFFCLTSAFPGATTFIDVRKVSFINVTTRINAKDEAEKKALEEAIQKSIAEARAKAAADAEAKAKAKAEEEPHANAELLQAKAKGDAVADQPVMN